MTTPTVRPKRRQPSLSLLTSVILTLCLLAATTLAGCGPSSAELAAVDYAPVSVDDWPVSTPEEQGLDPDLVAELYYNASKLETIYSLRVFKSGHLVAEDYFHIGKPGQKVNIHSVTKSITSALVVHPGG